MPVLIIYANSTTDTKTNGEKPAAEAKAAGSSTKAGVAPSAAPFVANAEPKQSKDSKWPKGRKMGNTAANKA